jgi:predicted nucleic acid-binding Zn ribbon protein
MKYKLRKQCDACSLLFTILNDTDTPLPSVCPKCSASMRRKHAKGKAKNG